jgi:hypothetical protein
VTTVFAFFARSVIADHMGKDVIGLIALYSDIFVAMNFLQFGIQPAFLAALYEPVRKKDTGHTKGLLMLYKKIYARLGVVFIAAGVLLSLGLIYYYPDIQNVGFFFFLITMNYSLMFFFSYPMILAEANQEIFYFSNLQTLSMGIMAILRVLIIPHYPSFYIYILTHFISVILCILVIHRVIYKKIALPAQALPVLAVDEGSDIFRRMFGYTFHNLEKVMEEGINSLYVVVFGGLALAASFSSYSMIILTLKKFTGMIFKNITASIGNLIVSCDTEHAKKVYDALLFASFAGGTAVALGFLNVVEPFMLLWLGPSYILSNGIRYGFALLYLLNTIQKPTEVYKNVKGIFYEDRYIPLIGSISNIGLCILLGYNFGPEGIVLANIITILAISFWQKPYMVYRHIFDKPLSEFINQIYPYAIVAALSATICSWICTKIIFVSQISQIFFNGLVSTLLPILIFGLFFFRSGPCQYIMNSVKNVLKKKSEGGQMS